MEADLMITDLTEDEAAVILKMREWKDGIPEEALGKGEESAVYVHLVAARAELYKLAIRHMHNDLENRRARMLGLVSPWLLIELSKAWLDLRDRERDDEYREAMEDAES
jgi:hypothetical protein